MDLIQHAKTCQQQEFCTDCPIRGNCRIRLGFYESDEKYSKGIETTNFLAFSSNMALGADFRSTMNAMGRFTSAMDKKRKREKELYPLYSIQ